MAAACDLTLETREPSPVRADDTPRIAEVSDESTAADSGAEETVPVVGPASKSGQVAQKPASTNSSSGVSSNSAWWQLIWCHERCHKQDCDDKRFIITEAAEESGASLLCLKKAAKYSMWMEQAQRPPYALLTDWREVKPCLQAAALHPPRNQPAFTVIFCELPKQYERASAWVQSLPVRSDPVHICRDVNTLKGFLADMVNCQLGRAALRSRLSVQMGPPGQFNSAQRRQLDATTQATGYGVAAWDMDDAEMQYQHIRKQRDSMWLQPMQAVQAVPCLMATQVPAWSAVRPAGVATVAGMEPWGQLSHATMVASPIQVMAPVSPGCGMSTPMSPGYNLQAPMSPGCVAMGVMSPGVDHAEPQLIKEMLMNAMPDHYDD